MLFEELICGPFSVALILGFIIFVLFYRLTTRNHDYWEKRGIPYVKPLPLFGSLLEDMTKPALNVELERYAKLGPIYGYFRTVMPSISVAEPHLIKDIFVKDFQYLMDRRRSLLGYGNNKILILMLNMAPAKYWKRIRSSVTPAFTARKIKLITQIFKDSCETLIKNMTDASKKKQVNIVKFYDAFMMDVILSSAFSTKIDSHNDPNNTFVQHSKQITTSNWNISIIIYILFPFLRKFFIFYHAKKVTDFYKDAVLRIIAERKRTGQVRHDFLELMMETVRNSEETDEKFSSTDKEDQNGITSDNNYQISSHHISKSIPAKKLSEEELVAQCMTFFVAGYPTSTSTLSYTSYLLALHPEIQEKLRQEVDKTLLENEGELNYEIVHSMKYLDCVVSESLRLSPPVPRLERIVTTDYTLGDTGIVLTKGMTLTVPIAAMHRDPKYFPDPLKFNPDRFSPEEKDKHIPYTYLPFGCGPRNCIGAKLALIMIKMCLAYIIANFRINRCSLTKDKLNFLVTLAPITQVKEIMVELERRNDSPMAKIFNGTP
ncbi:cytochrome P450 3A8-like [Argiope bruennichi]|nr:cytochrome P450 3A8-like [Argiope bruennichi]